jgi:hypothetical protein
LTKNNYNLGSRSAKEAIEQEINAAMREALAQDIRATIQEIRGAIQACPSIRPVWRPKTKSGFWRDFVWLCVFAFALSVSVRLGFGRSVSSRAVGVTAQKMTVDSTAPDSLFVYYTEQGRIQAQKARENLMHPQ